MSHHNEYRLALINIKRRDFASPPLGLAYLATFVRKHLPHWQVRVIDANFERPYQETIAYQPDIVGISSITMHYNAAVELARRLRRELEGPIILGGVHISTCPESLDPAFDVAVVGEGEVTLLELLRLYERQPALPTSDLTEIAGLMFFADGRVRTTAPRALIDPLDSIPIPDRSFLSRRYLDPIPIPELGDRPCRSTAIMTSRGCPFKCVFCSTSAFWRKVRLHSAGYVASEVRYLVDRFDAEHIKVWDDTIFGKGRLRELNAALEQEGVLDRVRFTCQLTASLVDDELCELLRQVGVAGVCFGFESGSDRILKYLKGGAVTVSQNLDAVETCKRHGLYVTGSLMFGSPGETREDIAQTLDFIDAVRERGADQVLLFVTQPFPGTELWHLGQERGLIREDFDYDRTSKYDEDSALFLDESVSPQQLRVLLKEAKRKVRRFPSHSLRRRLRILVRHPIAVGRVFALRSVSYSLFGVRVKRIRKRLEQLLEGTRDRAPR